LVFFPSIDQRATHTTYLRYTILSEIYVYELQTKYKFPPYNK
jgi:hypothetical protein